MKTKHKIMFFIWTLAFWQLTQPITLYGAETATKQSPMVVFQEALYQEQTEGNLDKAIELYEQVLDQAAETERLAARASYQLGMCHLKKGDKDKAADYFRQLVQKYPKQTSAVKKAQKQLNKIAPAESSGNMLPREIMEHIIQQHFTTGKKASNQGIPSNTHIYGVEGLKIIHGGLLDVFNMGTDTWIEERKIGTFTPNNKNLKLYNELYQEQVFEWNDVQLFQGQRSQLIWTPDRPVKPGEFRVLGYIYNERPALSKTAAGYELKMQNHFGSEVFENFFLILPATMEIVKQSHDITSHQRFGDIDVYQFERHMKGKNNIVTVNLSIKNPYDTKISNVILQDSFEQGDTNPTGWQTGANVDGVKYLWDRKVGSDGTSSLCMKKNAKKYFPIAQWTRTIDHAGDSKQLSVSAQVRAQKAYKAVIDALFLDGKGEWIKHEWVSYIGAEAGDKPANHNWTPYAGVVDIPDNTKKIVISLQMYGPGAVWFDELEVAYTDNNALDAKDLVENFFKNNFRDITDRKTIEWGQPSTDDKGNISIRYKFEGKIWGKDKKVGDMIFTFDKTGKFVSHKEIADTSSQQGLQQLVEKFFNNNYRDITKRETLEWGQPEKLADGNVSIRYKYEATIREKETVVQEKIFTFAQDGKFISVEGVK